MRMRLTCIGVLAAMTIASLPAHAQAKNDPTQEAMRLNAEAEKAHQAGDYDKAIANYQKILETKELAAISQKGILYYNMACAKALKGKKEALDSLALAFQNGWNKIPDTLQDPDLMSLHGDPKFDALVKGAGGAPAGQATAKTADASKAPEIAKPAETPAPSLDTVHLDFKYKTIDDSEFDWGAVKGKTVALLIGGSWHSQFKKATPFLVKFADDHKDKNFAVVSLQFELLPIDEDNITDAKEYRKEFNVTWPMLYAGDFDAMATGVPFVKEELRNKHPIVVLFDTKGKARQMMSGTLDEAAFAKAVEALLAEPK
ncbi:MAG: hypothetical protein HYR85_28110 [Planctomycetes bacterium]|nr:hypothetical protein [Planctomycetota bacterium]MBI3848462.1 hypothetical protein [Planctomycetota bacterium]